MNSSSAILALTFLPSAVLVVLLFVMLGQSPLRFLEIEEYDQQDTGQSRQGPVLFGLVSSRRWRFQNELKLIRQVWYSSRPPMLLLSWKSPGIPIPTGLASLG